MSENFNKMIYQEKSNEFVNNEEFGEYNFGCLDD